MEGTAEQAYVKVPNHQMPGRNEMEDLSLDSQL